MSEVMAPLDFTFKKLSVKTLFQEVSIMLLLDISKTFFP